MSDLFFKELAPLSYTKKILISTPAHADKELISATKLIDLFIITFQIPDAMWQLMLKTSDQISHM